jgi:hypothetical protein
LHQGWNIGSHSIAKSVRIGEKFRLAERVKRLQA